MPFGILEDNKLDKVPGTGLLSDRGKSDSTAVDEAKDLKRGTGKYSHITLIPQPSDDLADPVFITGFAGASDSGASSAYVLLAKEFKVSVDEVASSFSSAPSLAISILLQNALSVKYGQRIVYLVAALVLCISCLWTALSPDLVSIRVARIFQGFGMASTNCLVATTLERIYFVHERGSRSIIWQFSVIGGPTLGSFIYGYIIQDVSWRLAFWLASIAGGLSFIAIFFFVPETTFRRQGDILSPFSHNQDMPPHAGTDDKDSIKEMTPRRTEAGLGRVDPDVSTRRMSTPSFRSQLKIYNGAFSDENIWKIFVRPFALIVSPVTWFMFLALSMPTMWNGVLSVCSSTIFTTAYHFNAAQTGLTNWGKLVGAVLALLVTGPLSDRVIVWISRRNRGVYEPEFRLVFMLTMLFGVFGYVGWGVGTGNHMSWIGAVACLVVVAFSLVASGGTAVTYLLDTHGADAQHVLSLCGCAGHLIFYGVTFVVNGLVASRGIEASLLILGACQAACWLATIPMYVYGKRVRSLIARYPRLFRQSTTAGRPQTDTKPKVRSRKVP